MIKLSSFTIEKTAALAPMAGFTDSTFRQLCRKMGAALTVSEMVSAKALCFGDKKTESLMRFHHLERPFALQIFGDQPEAMAQAAEIVSQLSPDIIDINMGCPAPKIASSGGGCGLMRDIRLAERVIRAVVGATHLPVSVKFRKGWDEQSCNGVDFAKMAEQSGAALVTVHGRTRQQMYAPPVDLEFIARVKAAVTIPVIGNGDVTDIASMCNMYRQTGCDLVMVGRGALGNPFLFRELAHFCKTGEILPPADLSERMQMLLTHAKMMIEQKGEARAMLELRHHCAFYIKGIRGAARLREMSCRISTLNDLYALCQVITEYNTDEGQ